MARRSYPVRTGPRDEDRRGVLPGRDPSPRGADRDAHGPLLIGAQNRCADPAVAVDHRRVGVPESVSLTARYEHDPRAKPVDPRVSTRGAAAVVRRLEHRDRSEARKHGPFPRRLQITGEGDGGSWRATRAG